jgi:hypothetical protein
MTTYTTRPDDRFYWVTENENDTFSVIPKQLNDREEVDSNGNPIYVQVYDPTANEGKGDMVNTSQRLISKGLKSQWIAQTKYTANTMLAQTDWTVIRKAERNVDIPANVVAYRAAVLAEASRLEAAITATTNVDELAAALQNQNWPKL